MEFLDFTMSMPHIGMLYILIPDQIHEFQIVSLILSVVFLLY